MAGAVLLAWLTAFVPNGSAAVVFEDGFEVVFHGSWSRVGEVGLTATVSHGGGYSYISYPTVNADPDIGHIYRDFSPGTYGYVSVWFYDDGGSGKAQMFLLRAGSYNHGVGVFTPTSASRYVCETQGAQTVTSVVRTVGWHEFRLEWGPGDTHSYTMKIDGATLCYGRGSAPTRVILGDAWSYVNTPGRGYWDDFMQGY